MNSSVFIALLLLPVFLLSGCEDKPAYSQKRVDNYSAIGRGKVDIKGGLVYVKMPPSAALFKTLVHVGSHVKAGDILATLNDSAEKLAISLAEAEIRHAEASLNTIKVQLDNATVDANHWKLAADAGVSEQQLAVKALQKKIQISAELEVAKSTLEIYNIKKKQAELALSKRKLIAPQAAEVIKIPTQIAPNLEAQSATGFTLLPNKPLIIRAEVNESFVSQVHVGSTATVIPDSGFKFGELKAHVQSVGSLLRGSYWSENQQPSRVIEVVLSFDRPQKLLVGQNLMVKFDG